MPPTTSVRTFIQALQSGKTGTTRGLDALFTPPYEGKPGATDIQEPGALNAPLHGWAVTALINAGLSGPEIRHMNLWPDDQKEDLRAVLAQAVVDDRGAQFFWGLHDGSEPLTEVDDSGPGDVIVRFLTPRSLVTQAGDEIESLF